MLSENSWVEPRLCDYDGYYFCPNCHWNSTAVIPARVIHNWDFEERKVCRASRQVLHLMIKLPVIKLERLNPRLFGFVDELTQVKLCNGRGYLCELCDSKEVIFPFDTTVCICHKCSTVFHKNCWTKKKQQCPKCLRLEKRASLLLEEASSETENDSK
uniref:Rubicon Homology domain-containing protein n=1 Tax=Timema genevievae TaxID=629358 RepID=A0A7R9K0F3_TIMGE|nr:unnamed protein product [Timema genevievae]